MSLSHLGDGKASLPLEAIAMFSNHTYETPYNTYPKDVTSPGPDQRPGVARAQREPSPAPEPQKSPSVPKKSTDDQGKPAA
jgi:hypothetical protein